VIVDYQELPGSPRLLCGRDATAVRSFRVPATEVDEFRQQTLGDAFPLDENLVASRVEAVGDLGDGWVKVRVDYTMRQP
jgi:hypothetical protein